MHRQKLLNKIILHEFLRFIYRAEENVILRSNSKKK